MATDTPIRLFILHRHCAFTDALASQLESDLRFYPLRRFEEPRQLLAALAAEPTCVVLVERCPKEVVLPDMILDLKTKFPQVKILPLDLENRDAIWQCRAFGASGFVPRDASLARLIHIVELVAAGEEYWEDVPEPPEALNSEHPRGGLTPREFQVLKCVAAGKGDQDIAEELEISTSTVKQHVHSILRKWKAPNREQAAWRAKKMGLLSRPRD